MDNCFIIISIGEIPEAGNAVVGNVCKCFQWEQETKDGAEELREEQGESELLLDNHPSAGFKCCPAC